MREKIKKNIGFISLIILEYFIICFCIYNKIQPILWITTLPFAVEEMLGKTLFDHQRTYGLLAIIGLIFLIFGVLSDESRQHMKILIHTASKGRGSWIAVKAGAALIITVIVWAVVYIPNLVNVTKTYGVWGKTVIARIRELDQKWKPVEWNCDNIIRNGMLACYNIQGSVSEIGGCE